MKKTLLISSALLAVSLVGCNRATRTDTTTTDTTARSTDTTAAARTTEPTVGQRVDSAAARTESATREAGRDLSRAADRAGDSLERVGDRTARAMNEMGRDISAKLTEWKLSEEDIRADVAANRPIVRTKDSAGAPTGNMDRSTLKSAVEGRIKADEQLANLKLDVNAQDRGAIELEGKARSADQIARAMALALDTEGVTKVTSKIRIDANAGNNR